MVRYGFHPTPFGEALFATSEQGLCALHFRQSPADDAPLKALRRDWPEATLREDPRGTKALAARIFFGGPREGGPLRLRLRGTGFQLRVWEALLQIPAGEVVTYEALARAIGRPGAARAVGAAVGANQVAWLIPCHRVVRKSGALGGYRWGPARKEAMLALEGRLPPPATRPSPSARAPGR